MNYIYFTLTNIVARVQRVLLLLILLLLLPSLYYHELFVYNRATILNRIHVEQRFNSSALRETKK